MELEILSINISPNDDEETKVSIVDAGKNLLVVVSEELNTIRDQYDCCVAKKLKLTRHEVEFEALELFSADTIREGILLGLKMVKEM